MKAELRLRLEDPKELEDPQEKADSSGAAEPGESLIHVPLDRLSESRFNPRGTYGSVEELAASLAAHGLLQPVVVRPTADGNYELIAGHRRTAAARSLGWPSVAAIVRHARDDEAHLLTIVENLQRDDLSPREQSLGLERLLRENDWTVGQVAQSIRRSAAFVSKRLRVFEDPILAPYALEELIPVALAEEILPLRPARKSRMAEEIVANSWGRADIRRAIEQDRRRGRRPRGLTASLRQLRQVMNRMQANDFTDADRAELLQWLKAIRGWAQPPSSTRRLPTILPNGRVHLVERAPSSCPEEASAAWRAQ